jgi:hypothetical protein
MATIVPAGWLDAFCSRDRAFAATLASQRRIPADILRSCRSGAKNLSSVFFRHTRRSGRAAPREAVAAQVVTYPVQTESIPCFEAP